MKDITIGVTISLKDDGENIWNNGICQNVINFVYLLKNSPNNYNVFILNTSDNKTFQYELDGITLHPIKDKIKEIDILFILGSQIADEDYNYLKNKNVKIVFYSCGSNYMLDTQDILFRSGNTEKRFYKHVPDEVWMIPQNMNSNKYYFETLYRRKAIAIPYIWSPVFIEYILKNHDIKCFYTPSDEPKRLSCFEPNIDVIKFAMYDILIAEQSYRKNPKSIKHFYVTNATKIKVNALFIDIVVQLDIVKDGIASFEDRYRTPYFLDVYTDIVIAHQFENPLNYAYLEALYLNYPIVHNASLMKDGGYYYEGFNVEEGSRQLTYAIEEHDKHIDEYNDRSKKILSRYLPTNEKSIDIYNKMINNLFKK
jgi:hypothetical protein